jgi:hypothetical protein
MNLRSLPGDYASFEAFNVDYERKHYRYTEANHRVGKATLELFVSWFPLMLRPLARPTLRALLDEPVIAGFGFPTPPPALRGVVQAALKGRGRALRWLPPRKHPRLRTEMVHRTYPKGYRIEELGPSGSGRQSPAGELESDI